MGIPDLPLGASRAAGVLLRSLADDLRQATLHVVWRHWRALGASTSSPGSARAIRSQVDPEALVLVSLTLMNAERRLGDLLHDWAAVNSSLLSVQRMRNLAAAYALEGDRTIAIHLSWFASTAQEHGKDVRWRPVAAEWPTVERPPDAAPPVPRRDTRRRPTPTRLVDDATLLLRLRLGLGVGVKADLVAYLLGTDGAWASVRELVTATSYTPAAVRRAVDDLATARLVEDREGSPAAYRANVKRWSTLLDLRGEVPAWADWSSKFLFVDALLRWATAAAEHPLSSDAFAARGRELLERHRDVFERDQIARWSERAPIGDWGEFTSRAIRSLARWMVEAG